MVSVEPRRLSFESWKVRVDFASGSNVGRKGEICTELSTNSSETPPAKGEAAAAGAVVGSPTLVPNGLV